MSGNGVMIWPDQSRYEGEFKNGMMNGQGIKQYAGGNRYVGQFKDDQMQGTGIWYDVKDQSKRQGTWVNNKRYSWISERQQYHVSGYGEQNSSAPFQQRKSNAGERLYRGGRWKDTASDATKLNVERKNTLNSEKVTVKRVKRGEGVRAMTNEQAQHQALMAAEADAEVLKYEEAVGADGRGPLEGCVLVEAGKTVGHGSLHFEDNEPYVDKSQVPSSIKH